MLVGKPSSASYKALTKSFVFSDPVFASAKEHHPCSVSRVEVSHQRIAHLCRSASLTAVCADVGFVWGATFVSRLTSESHFC